MDVLQIAIPTYNRSKYLDELLSSIPKEIKVVVSDNGSFTSPEVISKHPNASFIKHQEVLTVFKNWNTAARGVDAEWVIIPSDDDLFLEGSFETIFSYISRYPDKDMLIFGHKIVDENGKFSKGWSFEKETIYNSPEGYHIFKHDVATRMPAVVFKVSKLKELGYFDEKFELTAADSDLIQRMLLSGNVVFVPKIISAYRIWSGALTSQKIGSKLWLQEIDYWQNKVTFLGETLKHLFKNRPDFKKIKDEVYSRNLMGGIHMLKKSRGTGEALKFLLSNRYPWYAGLKAHFYIIKSLLL